MGMCCQKKRKGRKRRFELESPDILFRNEIGAARFSERSPGEIEAEDVTPATTLMMYCDPYLPPPNA
jgi:hypothetical protein